MKCPECQKKGKKSWIYEGWSTRTLMVPSQAYWDEDEIYHPAVDPNKTTTEYSCSNGHKWQKVE